MAAEKEAPFVEAASAGARMIEEARKSVVEVQSGGRGSGAGVVWSADGLVLTNNHVVAGGRRRRGPVKVTLTDGRTFDAEVVKGSRDLDLALLRLRGASDLPAATPGDSDALRVGALVFAIGHPWGRRGAVTAGVVSGLGVSRRAGRGYRGWGSAARHIESDVALAPGNSGGPLLNARGQVVGINSMIFGRTALSIPSSVAGAWVAGSGDERPRLGVGVVPVEIPAAQRPEEGDGSGLVVSSVEEGGPADRAGLLVGDVLLGLAGVPPQSIESFQEVLSRGDAVSLRVMRGGASLILEVPPRAAGRAA